VWDLKEKRVSSYFGNIFGLISCFDPYKSLYLYEPVGSLSGPYYDEHLLIPTVCTVSPDIRRYKAFAKNGAVKLYMPTWTLPELLAVGNFVADRHPEEMKLTEGDIKERYSHFGVILRHVFSSDADTIHNEQKRAIEVLDPKKFFLDELDRGRQQEVSHYVAQYEVKCDGDKAFRDVHIDLVSDHVREAAQNEFFKLDLNQKIRLLCKNDESPSFMASVWQAVYEEVILQQLVQGVCWEKRNSKGICFF
jgi:hypothetical protein